MGSTYPQPPPSCCLWGTVIKVVGLFYLLDLRSGRDLWLPVAGERFAFLPPFFFFLGLLSVALHVLFIIFLPLLLVFHFHRPSLVRPRRFLLTLASFFSSFVLFPFLTHSFFPLIFLFFQVCGLTWASPLRSFHF